VGKKRYVHGVSNFLAIGIKSFSPAAIPLPFGCFADRLIRDFCKLRFHLAWLDIQALVLTFKRLPELLEQRRVRAKWNALNPGQGFYREPAFDYKTIADNRHVG
jgi:hypothetical protein